MNTDPPQTILLEEVTTAQLLQMVADWNERRQQPVEITLLTKTDAGFWTFRGDGIETLVHALEAIAYTNDAPEPVMLSDPLTAEQRAVLSVLDLLGVNRLTVAGNVRLEMSLETLLETVTRHMTWAVEKRPATTRLSMLQAHVGQFVTITTVIEAVLGTRHRGLLKWAGRREDGRFQVVDAARPKVIYAQFAASDVRKWAEADDGLVIYLPRVIAWNEEM